MTANNAELSRDLTRRSIRIRIDAKSDKPEEGRVFKHPDLLRWVAGNRGRLVHAVLVLIQNWVARGRRASFESWSEIIGGILAAAGVGGFLDGATVMDNSDLKRDEATAFVEAWHQTWPNHPDCTAKELLDVICAKPVSVGGKMEPPKEPAYLPAVLSGITGSRSVRLGKWLHANLNRVFGAYVLLAGKPDTHTGVKTYKLVDRPALTGGGEAASSENTDPASDQGAGTSQPTGPRKQDAGGCGGSEGGALTPPAPAPKEEPQP
jgi:hypothetical protein